LCRAQSSYLAVASMQQAFPQLLPQVPFNKYLRYETIYKLKFLPKMCFFPPLNFTEKLQTKLAPESSLIFITNVLWKFFEISCKNLQKKSKKFKKS
jgi:hypothetical protein